ncbi:TRAP transporter substrate-binding protein [Azospirillum picis]|uniref:Tripartite ATP-independent transporter DctP family solute receptor n=1 Tax=Azospirillum picis TaxID=488438 RepID=A0ABU0MDN7_9PROT|nr:TRAP transporter substrate-binding protein [Azospirillum picis]MBP2297601.1 tripartite ATP-independent transporter DctP family solute receptor [Azospirillum picis]MDQ0531376.1 tripartite ATP-independent transporter DctP family solute receptor [Azospirillum picis]
MKIALTSVRTALLAACAVCSMLTAPILSAPADARDFRSADIHPTDYPTVEAVRYVGKLVAERSNGRLGVKVFPNGALGTEKDTIEQLKIGALEMMRINVAPLNNVVPETMVTALPFIFRSTEHMRHVLDGAIGDEILAAMESQGMIGLAFYDSGSRSMYSAAKPYKTLADMKGAKIRVQQSDLFVAMIQALGANATPMPFGEVYTALKTGIVDAAENNYPSYESSRHFEAAKYFTLTEHAMAPEVLVFSKVAWDRLSKDDQALIRQAAKESVPYMRKLWDEREAKSREIVTQAGAQIVEVANKQEFIDAMKPVYTQFANTPKLQSLVQRVQEAK